MKLKSVSKKGAIFLAALVGCAIYFLLYLLTPIRNIETHTSIMHVLLDIVFFSLASPILWKGNSYINNKSGNVYKWEVNPVKRLILQIIGNTVFTFGSIIIMMGIYSDIFFYFVHRVRLESHLIIMQDVFKIFIIIFLFYQAIYIGIYFFKQWEKSIRNTEKLKQDSLHSQLHALQNQANPHFLFNSLNVLTSLIEENPKTAVEFVKKLSDVYRYLLQKTDEHLVELEDELNFINSYLFLQQKRFGSHLVIEINIPDSYYSYFVAPYTLQILFENAIKHNIISSDKPLKVKLYVDRYDNLVVENNIQLKLTLSASTGIGLKNIADRYRILAEKNIEIIKTENLFKVVIPLLRAKSKYEVSDN